MPDNLQPRLQSEIPLEVRTLGQLACDAELIASQTWRAPAQRFQYRQIAAELRTKQFAILERAFPADPVAICEAAMRQEAHEALYAQPPYGLPLTDQRIEDAEQEAYVNQWRLDHPRRQWHMSNFTWFAVITFTLALAALIWGEK